MVSDRGSWGRKLALRRMGEYSPHPHMSSRSSKPFDPLLNVKFAFDNDPDASLEGRESHRVFSAGMSTGWHRVASLSPSPVEVVGSVTLQLEQPRKRSAGQAAGPGLGRTREGGRARTDGARRPAAARESHPNEEGSGGTGGEGLRRLVPV